MFFGLKRVKLHPLYELQNALECFFQDCAAADKFDVSCFPEWFRKVLNRSPALKERFKEVADIIHGYSKTDRKHVLKVFRSVNNVKKLCGDKTLSPETLSDGKKDLLDKLKELFDCLYDDLLKRKNLFEGIRDCSISNHYEMFRDLNEVCPFCGFEKYPRSGRRASYDHYLRRSTYFLAEVNFDNLVPMCDKCNERPNKGTKDVLYLKGRRRSAFYPYSKTKGASILISRNINRSGDEEWSAKVEPVDKNDAEKVGTWDEVFNVSQRLTVEIQYSHKQWMKQFVTRRFADSVCNEERLRIALKVESDRLAREIREYSGAVLESALMKYLANEADEAQLKSYCQVAESGYTNQMSRVGAGLIS